MKNETKITGTLQTITPAMAIDLLKGHTNYRSVVKNNIDRYVRHMKGGEWKLSTIIIGTDGKLLDGQHRLLSLVKANMGIAFYVIRNWPIGTVDVIDLY